MELLLNSLIQGAMFVVLIASIFMIWVLTKDMLFTKDWTKDPSNLA